MKSTEFYLRKEFIDWLRVDCGLSSGSSYASYITLFLSRYSAQVFEESQFKSLADIESNDDLEDIFVTIFTIINSEKNNSNALLTLKELRDSASALKKYQDFLGQSIQELPQTVDAAANLAETSLDEIIQIPPKPLQNIKYIYLEVDEIKTNFTNRLMTQDRFYGNVFFPISIIKKVLLKNGLRSEFEQWINEHLNKIKLHTNDKTLALSEINFIKIESNGEVALGCIDGNSRLLYTQNALNDEKTRMYVSAFKQIVIDHVVSMKEILIKNQKNLPAFEALTIEIKKTWGKDFLKRNELREAGNKLLKTRIFTSEEISNLITDLKLINSQTELQLMDGKQNSIKRAN